jgi:hypothetical protein
VGRATVDLLRAIYGDSTASGVSEDVMDAAMRLAKAVTHHK